MTNYYPSDPRALEHRITTAFAERAQSMPLSLPSAVLVDRSPRRHVTVAAVAVSSAVVAAAVIGAAAVAGGKHGTGAATRVNVSSPPTSTLPAAPNLGVSQLPPAIIGSNVPLSTADNSGTEFLIKIAQRPSPFGSVVPGTTPFAVQASGRAAVVVHQVRLPNGPTTKCMSIASAPIRAAGYEGGCAIPGQAATALLVTPDSGPVLSPQTNWYIVWTQVPQAAAYVTTAMERIKSGRCQSMVSLTSRSQDRSVFLA